MRHSIDIHWIRCAHWLCCLKWPANCNFCCLERETLRRVSTVRHTGTTQPSQCWDASPAAFLWIDTRPRSRDMPPTGGCTWWTLIGGSSRGCGLVSCSLQDLRPLLRPTLMAFDGWLERSNGRNQLRPATFLRWKLRRMNGHNLKRKRTKNLSNCKQWKHMRRRRGESNKSTRQIFSEKKEETSGEREEKRISLSCLHVRNGRSS